MVLPSSSKSKIWLVEKDAGYDPPNISTIWQLECPQKFSISHMLSCCSNGNPSLDLGGVHHVRNRNRNRDRFAVRLIYLFVLLCSRYVSCVIISMYTVSKLVNDRVQNTQQQMVSTLWNKSGDVRCMFNYTLHCNSLTASCQHHNHQQQQTFVLVKQTSTINTTNSNIHNRRKQHRQHRRGNEQRPWRQRYARQE